MDSQPRLPALSRAIDLHCYREIPNEHAEVLVPEQPTLSIKVSVAPKVADGLAAQVQKLLTRAEPQHRHRGGDVINNTFSGIANETVIQIGKVHGQVNDNRGR